MTIMITIITYFRINRLRLQNTLNCKWYTVLWSLISVRDLDCRTVNARASYAAGRELESQRPAKSYIALQTVRHRFNIYASSCVALALCCLGAMTRRWALPTRYTLRRNTESIMKGLVFGCGVVIS